MRNSTTPLGPVVIAAGGLGPGSPVRDLEENLRVHDLYRSPGDASRLQGWCRERLEAWPVQHEAEHVVTSLGRTHLTWAGSVDQAVCLYLPGTNFNAATSTALLTQLSDRWRVVCADLPGQPGLSTADRPVDEVAGYSRWLTDVIEHVRQQRPSQRLVIAGHSRGAAAALLADPSDVDGLVLVSPAGLAKVRLTPAMLWRSIAWLVRPTPERSRRLVALMAGGSSAGLESVADWLTLVASSTRTTGAPHPLPAGVLDRWYGRTIRMLVGERDVFFTPAALQGPARRLGARLDVVPTAGHLLTDQRPDLLAAALSDMPTRP